MKSSKYLQIDYGLNVERKVAHSLHSKIAPHYHNAYEIHYFLEGNFSFFVRNQNYKIKKGDLLFIDTYEIHNPIYKPENTSEKILITYRPSFAESSPEFKVPDVFSILNDKYDGNRLISAPVSLQQQLQTILFNMLEIKNGASPYMATYLHLYLSLFLTHTADYLNRTNQPQGRAPAYNQKIKSIISFIDTGLGNALPLDKISAHFNLNKYYLCRFFKEQTGMSIVDYINRKRILAAEKLITLNEHPITDIAMMVGFNSLTHFERTFKRLSGMPPRNFRNNVLKQSNDQE